MGFSRGSFMNKFGLINLQCGRFFSEIRSDAAIRVRFAPSPTGFLHLGGLRTALNNYLFAKGHGGSFLVRIEDTDQSRLVPGATEKLLDVLNWCQLKPDEGPLCGGNYGPYVQSKRLAIHQEKVNQLIEAGTAYRCFCTERRLDLVRKEAIKLQQIPKYDNRCRNLKPDEVRRKMEDQKSSFAVRFKLTPMRKPFHDLVYGPINYDPVQYEGDPVILKSDGFPTYHLANVVDDHLMEISHVLRGVEWQVSTPKHILLYEAFGWEPPHFAHLPLIVNRHHVVIFSHNLTLANSDGSKLSKRQGDLHVGHFKDRGYFPEALLNFVASMGGGFGKFEGIQVQDLPQLIQKFSLNKVNVNSCKLELDRLDAFNQSAIHTKLCNETGERELVDATKAIVQKEFHQRCKGIKAKHSIEDEYIRKMLHTFKTRISNLNHLVTSDFSYIWSSPDNIETSECAKLLSPECIDGLYKELMDVATNDFTRDSLHTLLKNYAKQNKIKFNELMKFIRMAVSGLTVGPPVGEMLEVLGKETSVLRIKQMIANSQSTKT